MIKKEEGKPLKKEATNGKAEKSGTKTGVKKEIEVKSEPNETPKGKAANGKVKQEANTSVKQESKTPVKKDLKTPISAAKIKQEPKEAVKNTKKRNADESVSESPKKRKKKEEEEEEVWRWWEEKKYTDGRKWTTLEHKGPMFAEDYIPLPDDVKFFYDGHPIKLSPDAEEVMTFYAKMIDHDYTKKDIFNTNFYNDWRKVDFRF